MLRLSSFQSFQTFYHFPYIQRCYLYSGYFLNSYWLLNKIVKEILCVHITLHKNIVVEAPLKLKSIQL
jgi:hypothetical protein